MFQHPWFHAAYGFGVSPALTASACQYSLETVVLVTLLCTLDSRAHTELGVERSRWLCAAGSRRGLCHSCWHVHSSSLLCSAVFPVLSLAASCLPSLVFLSHSGSPPVVPSLTPLTVHIPSAHGGRSVGVLLHMYP